MAGSYINTVMAFLIPAAVVSVGCNGAGKDVASGLQSELGSERASACVRAGQQRDESVLPLLVDRLEDSDADVRLFAIGALKKIAGKDLGYRYYASESERSEVVRKWRNWLQQRQEKISGG